MTDTVAQTPSHAVLARQDSRRRAVAVVVTAIGVTVLAGAIALAIGPVSIDPRLVPGIMSHHILGTSLPADVTETIDHIVWRTRAPRIAMGLVAGAGLAVAGALLQALVRNGLADPYLLGINAGASTGVATAVLVIGGVTGLMMSAAALLGAIGATALVLFLAGSASTRGPLRLVLAGLAVGYALNAVTSFLLFWTDSPEAARAVLFWLLGSLVAVQPVTLAVAACVTGLAIGLFIGWAPRVDAMASGDDSALSAGLDPERTRFGYLAGASAMVGVIVAGVGGVGFVGLVVPHLARALVGGRHRAVLPVCAALGATLLVAADTVARTALAPMEIPVGVVTGVIGAPFLLLLLRRPTSRS
ncbi:MAG: FecCD family ABC transporter permease [Beutenbergiaceae bacterium]